jgi:hypothetical protein
MNELFWQCDAKCAIAHWCQPTTLVCHATNQQTMNNSNNLISSHYYVLRRTKCQEKR